MPSSGMSLKGAAKPECKRRKLPAALCGIVVWAALTSIGHAQWSITLAWDASPDPAVAGYRLYEGGASRNYTNSFDTGSVASRTVSGLVRGAKYYFAVTAYDTSHVESDFSNEVIYTVPLTNQPPMITSFGKLTNGNFSISGTSGGYQTLVLMAASQSALPMVWTPIATNAADGNGLFSCLDLRATNYPKRYYRVQGR